MGDVGRPLRPIAPRSAPPGGAGGAGGGQSPGNNGGGPSDDGRMKRASTACKECQRRRTRCSGSAPCTECIAHCRECVFDELADRRRKASARRTQEELFSVTDFIEQFLNVFRVGNNAEAEHLINTIRSGVSNDGLRATVLQLQAQNPNLRYPQGPNNEPDLDHRHNFFDPR